DRFELSREVEFTSFALPYIVGEIKRFFRDTTWAVNVPRRLQELRVELAKAREELASRLDREPTVAELATLMNITEDQVIEGQIEPWRAAEFTCFALPYIVGEIKRFFRDTTWAVHVPRRLQELRVELAKAREELASRLDREPTVAELATLMNITEDQVIEGQIAANGYNSSSLDAALTGDGPEQGEAVLADFIGVEEEGLRLVEDFHALAPLMAELSERDRQIIHMRFVE